MKKYPSVFTLTTLLASAGISRAQWFQTHYELKGGWNAIYLHGDATHATPEVLFPDSGGAAAVQEVWRWNAKSSQGQFSTSSLVPYSGTPEWVVWKRGLPAQSTLSLFTGQTAYLVKCAGTAADTYTVPITQRAMPPAANWVRSGANLLGFPSKLSGANYPLFSSYFASFPVATAANAKIFKYTGGDLGPANPLQIFSPATEPLDRNKAYWFEAEVVGNFSSPLDISLSKASGLDFGRTGSVITARVRNTTSANILLVLTPLASAPAPAGQDAISGPVPLTRRFFDTNTATWTEAPVTGSYTEVIPANGTVELGFGVDRAGMNGPSNALYANLLRLTDSGNLFEINLPVSARVSSVAGLWVGDVTITNISSKVQTTATARAVLTNGVVTGIELLGGGFGYSQIPVPDIAPPAGVAATATATLTPGKPATATAVLTSGAISGISITDKGTGYGAAPTVTIAPPGPGAGTTATATATIAGGSITGITITSAGSGYTTIPTVTLGAPGSIVTGLKLTGPGSGYPLIPAVTIDAPVAGSPATAQATVKNGVVTGISLTGGGYGYMSMPAVTVQPPAASPMQAVARANLTDGTVTTVTVIDPGAGYFSPPAITVAPPVSGTAAVAEAQVKDGRVTGILVTSPGTGYTAVPEITITAPPPRAGATATATVQNGKVTGFTVTNGGGGYLAAPAVTIPTPVPSGTATARNPALRTILHVDDMGDARLLSQVFLGILADGSQGVCTREAGLRATDKASALRLVAAHMPLDRVIDTGSGMVAPGQTLTRTVTIPFDDPTNPFVHGYHPDHNNKDARGNPLPAGVESYNITRTFSYQFTSSPPAGTSATGWGSTFIGGNYTEVIKGLHKEDLVITGTFVLRRASENGTLTVN